MGNNVENSYRTERCTDYRCHRHRCQRSVIRTTFISVCLRSLLRHNFVFLVIVHMVLENRIIIKVIKITYFFDIKLSLINLSQKKPPDVTIEVGVTDGWQCGKFISNWAVYRLQISPPPLLKFCSQGNVHFAVPSQPSTPHQPLSLSAIATAVFVIK